MFIQQTSTRLSLFNRGLWTPSTPHRSVSMAAIANAPLLIYDLAPSPGVCPYAQRAKITLVEKAIPFEQKLIDSQNKPQDFLDLFRSITSNPEGRGTVPTIIDGDVKLTESAVVAEYLDNAYPGSGPKIFPTDPLKLALVRLFVENYNALSSSAFKLLGAETKAEVAAAKETFTKALKVLNSFLKDHGLPGGDYLLGDEFSYAEVATLPSLYRAAVALPPHRDFDLHKVVSEEGLDRLAKWIEAGFQRPSVKDTLPSDESIVKGWGKFVKQLKD